ncbi:MAG: KH domain-containing protein [Verrucomicrobiota bacterium]
MAARISKIASSLKQIGDIQVAEWDFMGLLNTEIRELEVSRSLRRLGAIKVTDWDFSEVLPAIRETANREVDLAGLFRKAAQTKVLDWDFGSTADAGKEAVNPSSSEISPVMETLKPKLVNFLRYVVVNLIDEPEQASIEVRETGNSGLCFKVVLVSRDVAMLIGREGHTAAAIRRILQAHGARHGVQVLLHIQTRGDDTASD